MPTENEYSEIIKRLKTPGYLEKFEDFFKGTERNKTIPEMIKKRLGLFDGNLWTYKQIGQSISWVSSQKRFRTKEFQPLSTERIRQCLFKGYRIILKYENQI